MPSIAPGWNPTEWAFAAGGDAGGFETRAMSLNERRQNYENRPTDGDDGDQRRAYAPTIRITG